MLPVDLLEAVNPPSSSSSSCCLCLTVFGSSWTPPLPSALLLANCPCCCGQCTAPPFPPLPRTSSPSHPPPPSRGPSCVGRIAHSTRHVCCSFTFMWRCEAGLCDALTPVIVSSKCKAVAPSCGQVFSWEFYSGTVAGSIIWRGEGGQTVLAMGDPAISPCVSVRGLPGPGCPQCPASAL